MIFFSFFLLVSYTEMNVNLTLRGYAMFISLNLCSLEILKWKNIIKLKPFFQMRSGLRSQSKKSIPETTLESIQSCTAKSINSLAQKKRGNKNHSNATENRQVFENFDLIFFFSIGLTHTLKWMWASHCEAMLCSFP